MEEQEMTLEDWREMAITLQWALGYAAQRMVRDSEGSKDAAEKLTTNLFKTAMVTVSVMTRSEKLDCIAQLIVAHRQRSNIS